ncbi:MAG: alpha/beta hydrolase family protein [Fimbriimonas sp.]
MNLPRTALLVAIAWVATTSAFAQTLPAIDQVPNPIPFADWEEVSRPEAGIEYLVNFPSPVLTGIEPNDTVPLRVFLPSQRFGPVPVVLVMHYWGALDLRVERTLALELNRRGVAAAVITLPYHLARTPAGYRSGQLAIQPDVDKLKGTMVQAVQDSRRAIEFLRSRPEIDGRQMGIFGTSLGALVSASVYGIDDRLTHGAFLLGGVDLAGILWSSSRVVGQREALRRRGYNEERLREALSPIEPARLLERRKDGSAFVVGGLFDTVVPRRSTERLIALLPSPRVLWIDTGHYGGIFVQRRLMREVANYFATEFTGGVFEPPRRLYAPTVRIGFRLDTANGVDVGVGLDLLKFDARGDNFATLLLTPRGPNVFLGRRVSQGLAIGAFGSTRGGGVGLFWSTVL